MSFLCCFGLLKSSIIKIPSIKGRRFESHCTLLIVVVVVVVVALVVVVFKW